MRLRTTLLAAACASVAAGSACAQMTPEFRFSGFGTLAVVHSSEDQADYVSSIFQPTGAGYTDKYSVGPDTKLGLQGDVKFGDRFSAVVQVVSQQQYDKTYRPMVEWANVKFQATPEVSLRLGRIALPAFMVSDSRLVGYANPWIRTPIETYNLLPLTSSDGADASWRTAFGSVNNALQVYLGRSTNKTPFAKAEAERIYGFSDQVEVGSLTLHGGYTKLRVDFKIDGIQGLYNGLTQFAAGAAMVPAPAFQTASAQAGALAGMLDLRNVNVSLAAVGATWDPGSYFVTGEFARFNSDGFIADQSSWYVTAGWRFGSLTPYATYAKLHVDSRTVTPISTVGAEPLAPAAAMLNGGATAILGSRNAQSTASVGLRWDAYKNVAVKAQYDHVDLTSGSAGRLTNLQPGFVPGGKVNVVSVGVDFVF